MSGLPKFRITIPDGRPIFGRIEMDGKEMRGVTRIAFDTGEDVDGLVSITVTMLADDIEVEGEARPVVMRTPPKKPIRVRWEDAG